VKTDRSAADNVSQRRPSTSSSSGSIKGTSMSSVHSSSQGSMKGLQHQASINSSNQKLRQMDSVSRPPLAPVAPPLAPVAPHKVQSPRAPGGVPPPPPLAPVGANLPKHVPEPPSPDMDSIPMPPPPPAFNLPTRDYEEGKSNPNSSYPRKYTEEYIINQSIPVAPPPPPPLPPSHSTSALPSPALTLMASESVPLPPPPPPPPPVFFLGSSLTQSSTTSPSPPPPPIQPKRYSFCPSPPRSNVASPPPPPAFYPTNTNAKSVSPCPPPIVQVSMSDIKEKRRSLRPSSQYEPAMSGDAPQISITDIKEKRRSLRPGSQYGTIPESSQVQPSRTLSMVDIQQKRHSLRRTSMQSIPDPPPPLPSKSPRGVDAVPKTPPPLFMKPKSRPTSLRQSRPTSTYIREGHAAVDEIQRSIEMELEAMQSELFGDDHLSLGASATSPASPSPPQPPPLPPTSSTSLLPPSKLNSFDNQLIHLEAPSTYLPPPLSSPELNEYKGRYPISFLISFGIVCSLSSSRQSSAVQFAIHVNFYFTV